MGIPKAHLKLSGFSILLEVIIYKPLFASILLFVDSVPVDITGVLSHRNMFYN